MFNCLLFGVIDNQGHEDKVFRTDICKAMTLAVSSKSCVIGSYFGKSTVVIVFAFAGQNKIGFGIAFMFVETDRTARF